MSKKLSKRQFRIEVFKGVFQSDFYDESQKMQQLDTMYNEDMSYDEIALSEKDSKAVSLKCQDILDNISDIDKAIESVLDNWTINRIGKVELAILRVAVYEIKFDEDIPQKVAINEAVELAKTFCKENSSKYINGVLSGIVNE